MPYHYINVYHFINPPSSVSTMFHQPQHIFGLVHLIGSESGPSVVRVRARLYGSVVSEAQAADTTWVTGVNEITKVGH